MTEPVMVPFSIPLTVPFGGHTRREGVLVMGPEGWWGEFSPFPEYDDAYAARWLAAAKESAFIPWPEPVRKTIPVNASIPAVGPDVAAEMAAASGATTAKVKVGGVLDDDRDRVAAVRDALGPSGKIRVDANGGWTVEEALAAIDVLAAHDLEYVEQPCSTIEELAQVRAAVDVLIAADESVRRAEDPMRVVEADAADVVVLKVQPLGGVYRCLRLAERAGVPVVVSSALETSVGLGAGVALAAALPELPYACGLGTAPLLAGDVVSDPLTPVAGELEVRRPRVSHEATLQWRPEPDEGERLIDRLGRAAQAESPYR